MPRSEYSSGIETRNSKPETRNQSKMTDRYAVIGNPVAHSKSPLIHAAFARQTGEDIAYEALLAPLDAFAPTVLGFMAAGGRGMNVTVPFKQEAWQIADTRSPRAEAAKAVNTLIVTPQGLHGENTDGIGLVRDITGNLGVALAGKRVLLVGAGGAARGVILPLLEEQPASLVTANRTAEKAHEMAEEFAPHAPRAALTSASFEALAGRQFDVVINATSASLSNAAPTLPAELYAPGALAYDMMYGKGLTPFLHAAQAGGAMLADGLGMLVEQAAESFFLWRGVRPQTAPVLAWLRSEQA